MGVELAKAFVRVRADSSQLGRDFNKAEGPVKRGAAKLGGAIKGALAGALAGIGVAKVLGGIRNEFEEIDRITKLAKRTGFGTETIVALDRGAQRAGASSGQLAKALQAFQKRVGKAAQGTGEAVRALEQLGGVSAEELIAMDSADALAAVSEALGDLGSKAEQAAVASQLFSEVGQGELLDFLLSGKEEMQEMREVADKLGITFSQSMGKKVEDANDAMADAKLVFQAVGRTIAINIAPALKTFSLNVVEVVGNVRRWNKASGGLIVMLAKATVAGVALAVAIKGIAIASRLAGAAMKKALIGSGVGLLVVALGAAVLGVMKLIKTLSKVPAVQQAWTDAVPKLQEAWENLKVAFLTAWEAMKSAANSAIAAINATFGTNIRDIKGSIVGFITDSITRFAEFAASVAKTLRVIAENWTTVWELLKTQTAIVFVSIADQALMTGAKIKTVFLATVKAGIQLFADLGKTIVAVFDRTIAVIKGVFKGLWEAIKSGFAGEGLVAPFKETFLKEITKIESDIPSIGSNAGKVFRDTFANEVANMGSSPFRGALDALKSDADRLKNKLRKERQKLDEETKPKLEEAAALIKVKKEEGEAERRKTEPPPVVRLESGRFGFRELGRSLQDELLKGPKNQEEKQTKILGESKKTQMGIKEEMEKANESLQKLDNLGLA